MLTSRQKQMLQEIPKAENHIHIEGSIPWALALELAEKNHVKLPVHSTEEIAVWSQDLISRKGLDGFMICDRTLNSVCLHEEDYEAVVLALAKEDQRQNIIYQELHLDYPLNEERGIPLKVVMEGYRSAQKKAKKLYGVEIVYIAGLDRTLSSERCLSFVKALRPYLDMVAGLGMDCEENGHPCIKHLESYREAVPYRSCRRGRRCGQHLGCPAEARCSANRSRLSGGGTSGTHGISAGTSDSLCHVSFRKCLLWSCRQF